MKAAGEQDDAEERADEAAVKSHAAFPDFEDVERMGDIILRIVEQHVAEPTSDNDAEGAINEQVVDALRARPLGAVPVAVVRHHAADQEPAENEARDIGERIPADGQRPPLHENGIDRRKGQDKRRHRRAPDATGAAWRQGRATESTGLSRFLPLNGCRP